VQFARREGPAQNLAIRACHLSNAPSKLARLNLWRIESRNRRTGSTFHPNIIRRGRGRRTAFRNPGQSAECLVKGVQCAGAVSARSLAERGHTDNPTSERQTYRSGVASNEEGETLALTVPVGHAHLHAINLPIAFPGQRMDTPASGPLPRPLLRLARCMMRRNAAIDAHGTAW
jgi:hypothetical protein